MSERNEQSITSAMLDAFEARQQIQRASEPLTQAAYERPQARYNNNQEMIDAAAMTMLLEERKRRDQKEKIKRTAVLVGSTALTIALLGGVSQLINFSDQKNTAHTSTQDNLNSPKNFTAIDPIEDQTDEAEPRLDEKDDDATIVTPQPTPSPSPRIEAQPDKQLLYVPVKAATFNIFHSTTKGKHDWPERLDRSVETIDSNKLDVVGLQEARPNQQETMKDIFASESYKSKGGIPYSLIPGSTKKGEFTPNPILFNNQKYEHVSTDYIDYQYFHGHWEKAIAATLQDKETGAQFIFINTHDPADVGGEHDYLRAKNAKRYVEQIGDLRKKTNLPIIFVADFNTPLDIKTRGNNNTYKGDRDNTIYCRLAKSGLMELSSDVAQGLPNTNQCESRRDATGRNRIDLMFNTGDTGVKDYYAVSGGRKRNGSDVHSTIIATFHIPKNK